MSEPMPEVTGALTKKVGPLPGWSWLAIVVGSAWVYHVWRKRNSVSTDGGAQGGAAPTALVARSGAVGGGTFGSGGGIIGGSGTGAVQMSPGAPPVTTNGQWVRSSTDGMVAAGANPTAVTNALSDYLGGKQLDATAQAIVNQVLAKYGSPPEGIIAVNKAPVVTTPLAKRWTKFLKFADDPTLYGITPEGQQEGVSYSQWAALGFPGYQSINASSGVPGHRYTVLAGDTPASISMKFYGNPNSPNVPISVKPGDLLVLPN